MRRPSLRGRAAAWPQTVGDEVKKDQPAARIHFHPTPWRELETLAFKRDGLVLCKRVSARCERGDCLFHLATDVVAS